MRQPDFRICENKDADQLTGFSFTWTKTQKSFLATELKSAYSLIIYPLQIELKPVFPTYIHRYFKILLCFQPLSFHLWNHQNHCQRSCCYCHHHHHYYYQMMNCMFHHYHHNHHHLQLLFSHLNHQ